MCKGMGPGVFILRSMGNGHMEASTVTRQTHNTENITFPQLLWRWVNIRSILHPSKSVRDFALHFPWQCFKVVAPTCFTKLRMLSTNNHYHPQTNFGGGNICKRVCLFTRGISVRCHFQSGCLVPCSFWGYLFMWVSVQVVSVQGGLSRRSLSLSLSRGVCVQVVSVQEVCVQVVSVQGVSVQGVSVQVVSVSLPWYDKELSC